MSPTVGQGRVPPATSASFPVRAGNRVRPLVDGVAAFDRICAAVEAAERSVWVTVAFIEPDLRLPGGRGSLFDVLDAAAGRGLAVRALVWDPDDRFRQESEGGVFPAEPASHALLGDRDASFQVRWDRVEGQCQHQKSWLVDARAPGQVAFVGGINLNQGSVVDPEHRPPAVDGREGNIHDLYVEIAGPAAGDVAANFVERWNGASEREADHGSWPPGGTLDLGGTTTPDPSVEIGGPGVDAQVTRSMLPGLYGRTEGENSVREQYLEAIAAARDWIHIENQIFLSRAVLAACREALDRGVMVTALVPAEPMPVLAAAHAHPGIAAAADELVALDDRDGFGLAAPAVNRPDGGYGEIYVHAKAGLVDDAWATIGSTNLVFTSFQGDTEMNLSWWDAESVRALRVDLMSEHLGEDTARLDPVAAAERFIASTRANRARRERGEPLIGHAVARSAAGWGA